jgi:hypothetical protein
MERAAGHLRRDLWARFGKICRQESINEPELGGTVEFKFKKHYKIQRATQQTTLGHLRIERLSRALSVVSRALIEPLSSRVIDFCLDTMATTKDGMEITEMTTERGRAGPNCGGCSRRCRDCGRNPQITTHAKTQEG